MGATAWSSDSPGMTRSRRHSTIRPFDLRAARRGHGPYAVAGAIRVLVVDDHLAVRLALAGMLEGEDGLELAGLAADLREARVEAIQSMPDVAVLDYQLGDGDGLALCQELKQLPRPPSVLIYSAYADSSLAVMALVAGADGLISKGSLGTEVSWAIHALANGRRVLPEIAPSVAGSLRERLEPIDRAILGMLMEAVDEGEIAQRVGLDPLELDARRTEILRVLGPLSDVRAYPSAR
jgi:two-component system response regulator DevR